MNNHEALQALLDGKRIRRTSWPDGWYALFTNDGFYDEAGDQLQLCWWRTSDGDWEIHAEPKKKVLYAPAIYRTSSGGRICRTLELYRAEDVDAVRAEFNNITWTLVAMDWAHAVEVEE